MKTTFFLTMCLWVLNVNAQKITVGKSSNGSSTFIETYNYDRYNNSFHLQTAYRLGPSALKTLKNCVETAIKWAELNEIHRKTFNKEICRVVVMNKDVFDFHGYVREFTEELTVVFYGYSNTTFKIEMKSNSRLINSSFITISSKKELTDFKDMLNGKSVNKEIDDIFKL